MDSHPKKKKKYRANQKSNHGHVVGRDQYSLYSIQSKSKPNPITQHCNTEVFIEKKKKPNTEQKRNQTPDPEQTKPTVVPPLLVGAAHSVTSVAHCRRLVVVAHLLAVVARRLPVAADRRLVSPSQLLRCSALRYLFLFFSLTLSQSLTLSHTEMKNMK